MLSNDCRKVFHIIVAIFNYFANYLLRCHRGDSAIVLVMVGVVFSASPEIGDGTTRYEARKSESTECLLESTDSAHN